MGGAKGTGRAARAFQGWAAAAACQQVVWSHGQTSVGPQWTRRCNSFGFASNPNWFRGHVQPQENDRKQEDGEEDIRSATWLKSAVSFHNHKNSHDCRMNHKTRKYSEVCILLYMAVVVFEVSSSY